MLCQECKNAQASVHVKKREGDEEVSVHLCRACAKKMGWENPLADVKFPLAEFISGMMLEQTAGAGATPAAKDASEKCSECGLSFEEFARTGRLGCGHCYESFRTPLQELLRRIHGGTQHQGRHPSGIPQPAKTSKARTLRQLKAELDRAIAEEDFEKAATLRDQIHAMKQAKETKKKESAK